MSRELLARAVSKATVRDPAIWPLPIGLHSTICETKRTGQGAL